MQRVLTFLGLFVLLVLPACSPMSFPNSSSSNSAPSESVSENGVAKIAPMKTPPNFGDRAPLPGTTGREKTADGVPIMQPARGLNVSNLFSERIANPEKRTERVESAVQELRDDFDSMLPSLLRLVAVEKDINALVEQLETLVLQNPDFAVAEPVEPNVSNAPTVPAQAQTIVSPPRAAAAKAVAAKPALRGAFVNKVRTGIHADKARLVVDVAAPSAYTYEIDADEGLLIVSMPNVKWSGSTQKVAVKNPVIKSWSVESLRGGEGTMLVVELLRGANVSSAYALAASGRKSDRIVFDLK